MSAFGKIDKWIESQKQSGNEQVDPAALTTKIREMGRSAGWEMTDDPEDNWIKGCVLQYIAGMIETPLNNSPRYVTSAVEFPDMTVTIMACRPEGTTPIEQHDNIREMCERAGFDAEEMSLGDFVHRLIRRQ